MKRSLKAIIAAATICAATGALRAADVFEMPRIYPRHKMLVAQFQQALRAGRAEDVEAIARAGTALMPEDPTWRYNLACALSLQMKTDEALEVLERAIRMGFHDVRQISADTDFAAIRADPRFDKLLELAGSLAENPTAPAMKPARVNAKNEAWVGPSNTVWNFQIGAFDTFIEFPTNGIPVVTNPVVRISGAAGNAVRKWLDEGTAAGNRGDLYDNRDGGHSRLDASKFPQIANSRYSEPARRRNIDRVFHQPVFFHGPLAVLGNSSTATVDGPFWRCNGRGITTDPHLLSVASLAYFRNHLYIYPALHDYEGDSDHLPANHPYYLLSIGASWSDRPFMEACALSLAAMRPETKEFLSAKGLIAPTLQWAFRTSQKGVNPDDPESYMSGPAHPPAFAGSAVDALGMATLCHSLETNSLPPIVFIEMLEEPKPPQGEGIVPHYPSETLFDTPQALARLARLPIKSRRMVVNAGKSHDLNGKPLKWHWRLLWGDPDKVTITPLDDLGSKAEIIVEDRGRAPVAPGSEMLGTRVDIGVFADNGDFLSVPGFISVCFPANEIRSYMPDGRILTVDGDHGADTYADPSLFPVRRWIDVYHYDSEKNLTGWTRMRGTKGDHFTAGGALIETTDGRGRPLTARSVILRPVAPSPGAAPELEQVVGPVRWFYEYEDDADKIGKAVRHEIVREGQPEASGGEGKPAEATGGADEDDGLEAVDP